MRLFLRLGTQWNWASLNAGLRGALVRTGLKYEAVPIVASAMGLTLDEALLDGLRVLESETATLEATRTRTALQRH